MRPQIKSNGKFLVVAQWWAGDQDQMMALLKLMADLEPDDAPSADFLLFPRWDTKTRDWRGVQALKNRFTVYQSRSRRQVAGWPIGPNAMAMDVFKELHTGWLAGSFPYEAAFLIEADGLPTTRTWIRDILTEWRAYKSLIHGHWDGSGEECERGTHMNGNLVFHPEIVSRVNELAYGDVPLMGWDMKIWPKIKQFASPSRLIYSDYRLNTPKNPMGGCARIFEPKKHTHPKNPLVGEIIYPSYLHGIKGVEGINCVRSKFLLDT